MKKKFRSSNIINLQKNICIYKITEVSQTLNTQKNYAT